MALYGVVSSHPPLIHPQLLQVYCISPYYLLLLLFADAGPNRCASILSAVGVWHSLRFSLW